MTTLRDLLRATPSIVGSPPPFEIAEAPDDPRELFVEWLQTALSAGIPEPHALMLSTVDGEGRPDARVLVLKDVTTDGAFEIATGSASTKGRQLSGDPRVALTFYWTTLARSVRIRGDAVPATPDESAADFRARHPAAKAMALAGRQSATLTDIAEQDRLVTASLARIEEDPAVVSESWTVWRVHPVSIEFWQGDPTRNHLRLQYEKAEDGWARRRLWA